jgi:hypothetical protein
VHGSNLHKFVEAEVILVVCLAFTIGLGYLCLRAVRFPFDSFQARVWRLFVRTMLAVPILGGFFLYFVFSGGSRTINAWVSISLFVVWIAFCIWDSKKSSTGIANEGL